MINKQKMCVILTMNASANSYQQYLDVCQFVFGIASEWMCIIGKIVSEISKIGE